MQYGCLRCLVCGLLFVRFRTTPVSVSACLSACLSVPTSRAVGQGWRGTGGWQGLEVETFVPKALYVSQIHARSVSHKQTEHTFGTKDSPTCSGRCRLEMPWSQKPVLRASDVNRTLTEPYSPRSQSVSQSVSWATGGQAGGRPRSTARQTSKKRHIR